MKEKDSASQQFFIGIIANGQFKELALAVLPALEDRLNVEIDLLKYTDKIEKVFFTPILDFGGEPIKEIRYDEEEKKLSLRKSIPVVGLGALSEEGFEEGFEELISSTLIEWMEEYQNEELIPMGLIKRFREVLEIEE